MRIDIFSDTVCPWCFIGKRCLEAALAATPPAETEIHWHAFQLNPELPARGCDRREYLNAKFGGAQALERIYAHVREAGRGVGIDFQFEKITRSPNTFNSHRLIQLATTQHKTDAMVEALFRGYFLEGRDIGDDATLAGLAHSVGLEGNISTWLSGEGERSEVLNELQAGREFGISGVPFFIFASRYSVSGAQPAEVFRQAMDAARRPPSPSN